MKKMFASLKGPQGLRERQEEQNREEDGAWSD